jgi:glycosyltransferase involved in cell wall biosynthesis
MDLLKQFFRVTLLESNTDRDLHIDPTILGEAIVVTEVSCAGESGLPRAIAQAANAARASVIVEKHASESTTTAIQCLSRYLAHTGLRPEFIGSIGITDAHKDKAVAIIHNRSPLINRANQAPPASFRVVAIMAAYNEVDIIVRSVEKLLAQGVEVYLIDNWSTDGTYEAVRDFLGSRLAGLERFPPNGPGENYDLHSILLRKEEIAKTLRADWFIHSDVDEIRYGPWQGLSLRDAIYHVDQEGYNAIDYTVIEFHPIDNNFQAGEDFEDHFRYFSFYKGADAAQGSDLLQIRTWKYTGQPFSLAPTGGHDVIFENRRVYPYKFLVKHYPIRSQEHGSRKVFHARLPRFHPAAKARGWHVHYDALPKNHNFLKDAATLTRFEADQFYTSYLVQRLTGIGTLIK